MEEITKIIDLIVKAAAKIDHKYLRLQTTYEPSGIVRERVFCYELYHKLRILIGDDYPLTLNGEIDKRGHIDFEEGDRKNPDFVFHIPGEHEGNTILVEVKGVVSSEVNKDLDTIRTFITKYNYRAGVLLVYNHSLNDLLKVLDRSLNELANEDIAKSIYIITLPSANSVEKCILLSSIV